MFSGRIQDRPEDDSTFLANLHRSIRNSMHANGWAVAALVIFAESTISTVVPSWIGTTRLSPEAAARGTELS